MYFREVVLGIPCRKKRMSWLRTQLRTEQSFRFERWLHVVENDDGLWVTTRPRR